MDFALSEEQVMIRDMCWEFADEVIAPQAEVMQTVEGTSEVQRIVITRNL